MKKISPKGCLKGFLKCFLICIIALIGIGFFMDTEPPVMYTENQTVEYGTKLNFSQFLSAEDNESESDKILLEILSEDIFGLTIDNENQYILCERPGTYEIEVAATDEASNQTTDTVTIQVTDTQAPKILAVQDDFSIGYNESVDLFFENEGIQVQVDEVSDYTISMIGMKNADANENADEHEGVDENAETNETVTATVSGEGETTSTDVSFSDIYETGNTDGEIKVLKPGSYIVEFKIEDSYGNAVTDFATIEVLDKTMPVMECQLEQFELADTATSNDYRRQLSAIDEIDGNLSALIEIDDSQVEYGTLGEYQIQATVVDNSGNVCTETFPVVIKDKTAPKLTLSKTSFSLKVGDGEPDYSSIASAIDGIDGNVTSSIKIDDSAVNYDKAGTYKVKFTVTDSNGNSTTKEATVTVKKASTSSSSNSKASSNITSSGQQVMITKTGECYHTHKCGNGNYFWVSLSEAKARGLRPCKKCY